MSAKNKVLIYDEDCPLCSAYTAAFVKTGMLNPDGRQNFNSISPEIFNLVDRSKCNNEIPLVDTETRQVWYGIDALLQLLDNKLPGTRKVAEVPLIKWMLFKLYKFISYNRKVIVAVSPKSGYDSSPDFNIRYRLVFLAFFLCFNTVMLQPLYDSIVAKSFLSGNSLMQVQAAHLAFVTINITTAFFLGRKKGIEYLGQVNMLALIVILLLTAFHLLVVATGIQDRDLNNFYLGFTSTIFMLEYTRRMKYAGIIQQFPIIVVVNLVCLAAFILYLAY